MNGTVVALASTVDVREVRGRRVMVRDSFDREHFFTMDPTRPIVPLVAFSDVFITPEGYARVEVCRQDDWEAFVAAGAGAERPEVRVWAAPAAFLVP